MTKEQLLQMLVDLYTHTTKSDLDRELFEKIASKINEMYETNTLLDLLDYKDKQLKILSELVPVTELANVCGLSRMQVYRLLKDNDKLDIFKKYMA